MDTHKTEKLAASIFVHAEKRTFTHRPRANHHLGRLGQSLAKSEKYAKLSESITKLEYCYVPICGNAHKLRASACRAFWEKTWQSCPIEFIKYFNYLSDALDLKSVKSVLNREERIILCESLENIANILINCPLPTIPKPTKERAQRVHRDLIKWDLQLELLWGQDDAHREVVNLSVEQVLTMWRNAGKELTERQKYMKPNELNRRIGYRRALLKCLIERADELDPLGPWLDAEMVAVVKELKEQRAEKSAMAAGRKRNKSPNLAHLYRDAIRQFQAQPSNSGKTIDDVVFLFRQQLFDEDQLVPTSAAARSWLSKSG